MYFNDFIGNISTTAAIRGDEYVDCQYSPRFPVCGGWKTDWNQGYKVPTKYHLTRDIQNDNLYRLEIPFLHSYDVLLAENATVEVILPFGASDIEVSINGLESHSSRSKSNHFSLFFCSLNFRLITTRLKLARVS